MMNFRAIVTALAISTTLSFPTGIYAADIVGGNGIGFSNNPGQWIVHFLFNKNDLKSDAETVIKTGDDVTPPAQKGLGTTITVPSTKSMAWCDPVSNPDIPKNTDINECYGWAMHSKWAVLDFNALQKSGVGSVWVTVTAKRFNDNVSEEKDTAGTVLPSDDDLIPALTVFYGRQDVGAHIHWYPNRFQKNPFWAWKLSPFYLDNKKTPAWGTAYDTASQDSISVTGKLGLKAGNQNYLTVAVGGDARHTQATSKHDVNFQLSVKVSRKNPDTNGYPGSASGNKDQCGCEIGVTQWHPSMGHCMSVAQCQPIAGTPDECKTPEKCAREGR